MPDHPCPQWELATCRHIRGIIACATSGIQDHPPAQPLPDVPASSLSDLCPQAARFVENHLRRRDAREYVPTKDWSTVAQWRCRQITLRQLCQEVGRSPPAYQKHCCTSTTFGLVYRFFVVVPTTQELRGIPTVGRFSTGEYLALEDAASAMIATILEQTNKHLDDYNYDKTSPIEQENVELRWEVGYVKSRYKKLHSELRAVKRVVNPELLGSSDSDDDP
ncbi:hypothetical protein PIB30_033951 [Stylosanthes scabra]|uniref:Uncharacterized protein n=1 Tax=Stylosanthes scabra TaxID=79078 RepID=A0ABU6QC33_9FABA|nr:hypothetical protein [Stylosanthes scabra]